MGLDWTALEQGLERVAVQKAASIMQDHPGQTFYGVALHGVPSEEDGELILPVLALNSEQAYARDRAEDDGDFGQDDEDDDEYVEEEGGDWVEPPLDGSDPVDPSEDDDEDEDEDSDDEPEDGFDDDDDGSDGFYSRRWDPEQWHWNAVDLVEEAAAGVWERAFAAEVDAQGWSETTQRYYQLMLRVIGRVRESLRESTGRELVCFVADNDHAERLLRASLTPEQLRRHFPDLVA